MIFTFPYDNADVISPATSRSRGSSTAERAGQGHSRYVPSGIRDERIEVKFKVREFLPIALCPLFLHNDHYALSLAACSSDTGRRRWGQPFFIPESNPTTDPPPPEPSKPPKSMSLFQIGGRVAEVTATEGQPLKAGDVLARLDPNELQAHVNQIMASLDVALNQVLQQKSTVDMRRDIVESTINQSKSETEAASASLDRVRNGTRPEEIRMAEAQVTQAEADLERRKADFQRISDLKGKDVVAPQGIRRRPVGLPHGGNHRCRRANVWLWPKRCTEEMSPKPSTTTRGAGWQCRRRSRKKKHHIERQAPGFHARSPA
jgi:hypothetical protein